MNVIRYGKVFHYPRQLVKRILAIIYPLVVWIWPLPKVMSIEDTIDKLLTEKMSIARFGDGEFLYIIDKLSLPFQKYDHRLASILKEILGKNLENLIVGLPSGYYDLSLVNEESKIFWKSQISWIYPRLKKYLDLQKVYGNASISRLYIEISDKTQSKTYFEKIKKLWFGRNVILIEGEKSRLGVGNDLFKDVLTLERILAPSENAFDKFEDIIAYMEKLDKKDHLILIALGPTAKALAYHLCILGYQAIDIGNVDIEYEWYLQGAQSKVKIYGKYTSEAPGGRIVEDISDYKYHAEIITSFVN